MGTGDNLRNILNRQRDALTELENEVKAIENSDLIKENENLKSELEKLSVQYKTEKHRVENLSNQNASLKNALYQHIYSEKASILDTTAKKLDIYFKSSFEKEKNRLTALENSIKSRIDNMTSTLKSNNVDIKDDIYKRLDDVSSLLDVKITEVQKQFAQQHGAFSQNERTEFERLKNEQITDRQVVEIAKKNNFERFIGLNLLNIIGILLIIIGAATFANFVWGGLSKELQGIMLFVLGASLLVAGELLNRKKANIFSLGITAGGVAVLYVSLATSYFGLRILDIYPAIALCVLITVTAFFLSTRYNSQTVLALALVGGYLPMFSIGTDKTMLYGAMIYFVVLNILALWVSFKKKWTLTSYIGLFLNIIGTAYICSNFTQRVTLNAKVTVIIYILFTFLNYTLIPIIGTYADKLKFKKSDVVLLAINTFFSSLIMYSMFYYFDLKDYTGILAIIFAVVYLLLGRFIEKKFTGEKNTTALFYLTGLAFVVLVIPFQFGKSWLTLGWLAEGVALSAYGILKDEKNFKRTGFAINALCLGSFLFFDLIMGINQYFYYDLFAYKYLAVTLGSLAILGAYVYKKMLSTTFQKFYKYAVIINLWFYAIYISNKLGAVLRLESNYNISYLTMAFAIFLTFLIAYTVPRIKILSDTGVKIISGILYIFGIIWLFSINGNISPYYGEVTLSVTIVGTVILIGISLLSVLATWDLVKMIVMEGKLSVEWYPLLVSGYFTVILTQNLIMQYNLSFANMWISIIYVLTALAWIVFGFAKRYSFIRKFGLGLALLSVIKLFIIDLASLTKQRQIISYFALGVTLIAISFVYQYFNKRLELKMEAIDSVEE